MKRFKYSEEVEEQDTPPIVDEEPAVTAEEKAVTGMTTGPLWLRETPDEDGKKIEVITSGQVIDILKIDGDWAKITWREETGWVKSAWVKEV